MASSVKTTEQTSDVAPEMLNLLIEGLSKHQAGPLTDFRIRCGEKEWPVHRLVLSIHSPVLASACAKDFKEKEEGMIDLSEEDPRCISSLITYLYGLRFCEADLGSTSRLEFSVKMYILADKYNIPPLKQLSEKRFFALLDSGCWTHHAFAAAAALAHEAPGPTINIRNSMVKTAVKKRLLEDVPRDGPPMLLNVMKDYVEFAIDIASYSCSIDTAQDDERRMKCGHCGFEFIGTVPTREQYDDNMPCFSCSAVFDGEAWKESIKR